MGQLNIITLNFSRIRNGEKILKIMEKFNKNNIDIFCIQEIDVQSAVKYLNSKYQVFGLDIQWNIGFYNQV